MYNENCFYIITDLMHHNVYASLLKDKIKIEERPIIKVFKKDNQVVVIETNHFKDVILKDTRKNKNDDLMEYNLTFLKVLERYVSDYEIDNMSYEYIEGIGAWCKVEIKGFSPNEKLLKPFFLKKKITKENLVEYASTEEELERLKIFYDKTKGLLKFTKPNEVKKILNKIED